MTVGDQSVELRPADGTNSGIVTSDVFKTMTTSTLSQITDADMIVISNTTASGTSQVVLESATSSSAGLMTANFVNQLNFDNNFFFFFFFNMCHTQEKIKKKKQQKKKERT